MTKTCELCVILSGADEGAASRLRAAIAATTFDEIHNAKGLAYRLDGAWYDVEDIGFHLWGREYGPPPGQYPNDKEHRHTADYSLWR